jgi:hypothetical protein
LNDEIKCFMRDLVVLLHEKYNDTLQNETEKEEDKYFRIGMNHAYYDVLDLIQSQLIAFGFDVKHIGNITPELSKEAKI